MGVAIVRVLNPIKRGGIGGMTNNPVKVWPLRHHLVDSVLVNALRFWQRNFLITVLYLVYIVSYRIVAFNPDYTEGDECDDCDDGQDWGSKFGLTCL